MIVLIGLCGIVIGWSMGKLQSHAKEVTYTEFWVIFGVGVLAAILSIVFSLQ